METPYTIPDKLLLALVESMLQELIWKSRFRRVTGFGLCHIYITQRANLFYNVNSPYYRIVLETLELSNLLRNSSFHQLDKVLSRDYAVQAFNACQDKSFWWETSDYKSRIRFLKNAIVVIKTRIKRENHTNYKLLWNKLFLLKLK